jgi:hypothetical protein
MDAYRLRHLPKELADDILDGGAFEVLADGRKVLKPGRSFRTPMHAMDAKTVIGDGFAANRPGYRIPSASMHDSKQQRELDRLYAERDAETENGWREDYPGASEGDVCTVRGADFPNDIGSPGHIQLHEGRLYCVPDNPSANDARSVKQARDAAYRAYENYLVNAWRRGPTDDTTNKAVAAPPTGRRDTRSTADKARDHAANMQRIYAERDRELSEAWRNK